MRRHAGLLRALLGLLGVAVAVGAVAASAYRHAAPHTLWPEEAIGLADALRIYTLGGAAALRRETQSGSIVAGKFADFIVLNRNLFKMAASQISGVQVEMTFFQGQKVYERSLAEGVVKR